MAADLDEQVEQFRRRPYTLMAADAQTSKVYEGGRIVIVSAMIATGPMLMGAGTCCG